MGDIKNKLVMTRGVASCMPDDAFALSVNSGIARFMANDWGDSLDKELNDSDHYSAMGVYPVPVVDGNDAKIWIKADDYRGDPSLNGRLVTVLFPSEY